ncbi:MAG: hypothetical protein A3C30_05090 [Candidatus Levybacteria bacterium RIFCSPHIGHO2_02_FULL_40_18]|nr:MAG: hypothetical protein A2869_02750 [Candidatus Levybacteria bacterium RIFCSPHIGHO2_01_FULL_40_58]OGH26450.1 MAG: hypothetical protein A3C30_05090 [Candidatus Levybacteria bacterium RIFCSPHIGHO2_02_FULL_40_18]OGH31898.1 MAG: hypothetical protein A3E43_00890 [Candidatus Levybacteria bacterium RIFCSPHIGHO2_12_FULL_40_31]OGH40167.1 MAG: hypothetical protein A2894_04985 [Candidatus Levybacteria bacterium RIFCSPLOWO2_01_FULL_40_64]OGH49291.1 MAG: hypothetical protein A3I54_01435 [Candidatus Lev
MDSSGHYRKLADKWIKRHRDFQEQLWASHGDAINDFINSTKNFAIGSISGLMLLSSPAANLIGPVSALTVEEQKLPVDKSAFLASDVLSVLPKEVRPLTPEEENSISQIFTRDFGFKVAHELSGIRLNRSYGYIGAEQHLARYPGDTMTTHFEDSSDSSKFYSSGMAPGLGAWGYFANSRSELTQKDIDREKYYIAVQTFLAPGFAEHTGKYITFFKFRKMLVVNPHTGRAIVVVIGDAGPAEWTGKSLGGSPEVMKYLERVDGSGRGPVLYFFIDDPEDKVPLGPIEIK